jgi:hypothetical protein
MVFVRGDELTPAVRVTLAHELTHVLQDQHFDLQRLDEPDFEEHEGLRAMAEGDAGRIEDIYVTDVLTSAEQTAYETTQQWLANNKDVHVDLVFGANDRTAMGARKALQEADEHRVSSGKGGGRVLPLFCGIDGLPGEGGGIELVRDSILEASYIYPTHGDKLLQLAVDILEGKPYQKESRLQSALVTRDNANVLLMQTEELKEQGEYLDRLHQKADAYLQQLDTQRTITLLSLVVIGLLVIAIVLFYLYHIGKMTLRQERVVNTLWNMKPETLRSLFNKALDQKKSLAFQGRLAEFLN